MKKLIICALTIGFITNCSVENVETTDTDITQTYYTEFMACKAGPDQSPETMTNMISEWQQLLEGDSLVGSWGYAQQLRQTQQVILFGGNCNGHLKRMQIMHGEHGSKMRMPWHGKKNMLLS